MSCIAKEAAISSALLYRYFPNKMALFDPLREQAIDRVDAFIRESRLLYSCSSTPHLTLVRLGHLYAEYVADLQHMYLLWLSSPEVLEPYNDTLKHFSEEAYMMLADYLSRAGIASQSEAITIGRTFFGTLFSRVLFSERLGLGTTETLDSFIKGLVRFALEDRARRLG